MKVTLCTSKSYCLEILEYHMNGQRYFAFSFASASLLMLFRQPADASCKTSSCEPTIANKGWKRTFRLVFLDTTTFLVPGK